MKNQSFKILVVDDDPGYADACARVVAGAGYRVSAATGAREALKAVESDKTIRLTLTDLKMPEIDGIELLQRIKSFDGTIEVILMTGYGAIESAVRAIKEKATDYITKPFDKEELLNAIEKIYEVWILKNEVSALRRTLSKQVALDGFVFKGAAMLEVYDRILTAARSDCTVFITGETGTGKELIARAIHKNSKRASGPFMPINCGALSSQLIESELFGHKRGAFTGAERDYAGLFVAADGGTLFLDEVVEMPPNTQVKLLRSIQENTVRPVGSVTERSINVRFIAATNRDLAQALREGALREDLYHRLNVIPVEVPPLRSLRNEIPNLLSFLIEAGNLKSAHAIEYVEESALEALSCYHWPGNIRETDNLLARVYAEAKTTVVALKDLPAHIRDRSQTDATESGPIPSFSDSERDLVLRALREAKGNKTKAAAALGISRPRLYKKIELYGIKEPRS